MKYKIIQTNWEKNQKELSNIRREVFIEEQQVPEELEWDEFDDTSHHVLALDNNNKPIGCGRIKPDGQIGRMAVLINWRKQGIGKAILNNLLEFAIQSGYAKCYLHAQITAIPFYEKFGFLITSPEFMDAGIPHKTMKYKSNNIVIPSKVEES